MVKKRLELKDLAAGEQYAVQVRSIGDGSDNITSAWSLTLNFTTDTDTIAPAPPTGLSVVVDGGSFVGTWAAPVVNSDGSDLKDFKDYRVVVTNLANSAEVTYYTTNERFEFTPAMNESAFGTQPSGVADLPDFLYDNIQFDVYARDLAHNESTVVTDSAQNTAPGAVTLVDATDGQPLTAQIDWGTPSGRDILAYRVRRGTSTGVYDKSIIVFDTTFVDSGIARGEYFYIVEAYDIFGNMTASNEVSPTVVGFWESDFATPDNPTISNVASSFDIGTQTADLTFDVTGPATADSGAVANYDYHSHYVVRWSTNAAGPFQYQTIDETDNTATHSVSIQGLQPNTEYFYGVKSVSEYGQSGSYQTGSTTTAVDTSAPAAPANLSAAGSLKNITVSWDANSESDIAHYELYANQTSGFDPLIDGSKVYQGNGTGFAHSVGDSETWYYKVRVVDNSGNESLFSTEATGTSTGAVPQEDDTPPSDVTGVSVSATTYYHGSSEKAYADVSWTAATDNVAVTGYIVSYSVDAQSTWNEVVVGPDSTVHRVPDLEPGVEIAVRVKAFDAAGNKSTNWSASATATPTNTDGAVQEPVSIVTGGAIESDNFVAGTSGFRLDENSLEIYGDGTLENVSLILGGATGLNLNTTTNELWFGASIFADATWRVDGSGNQRVGGDGAFYTDASGNIWSGNSVMASAPWEITAAGAARFDNVKITGDSIADGQQVVNIGGEFIVTRTTGNTAQVDLAGVMNITGTLNVNSGSINLTGGDLRVTSGDIESSDSWVYGAGVGFRLINVNDATKPGVLQAQGAEIDSLTVAGTSSFGGTITVSNGSTVQSDTAGWSILGDGSATFSNVDINGGTLDIGANFQVTSSGVLTASGVNVTGTINANDGFLQNLDITGLLTATGAAGRVEIDTTGVRMYDDPTAGSRIVNFDISTGDIELNVNQGGDLLGDASETTATINASLTGFTARGDTTNVSYSADADDIYESTTTTPTDGIGLLAVDALNNVGNVFFQASISSVYQSAVEQGLGVHLSFSSGGNIDEGVTVIWGELNQGPNAGTMLTVTSYTGGVATELLSVERYLSQSNPITVVVRGGVVEVVHGSETLFVDNVNYSPAATNYTGFVVSNPNGVAVTNETLVIGGASADDPTYRILPAAQLNIDSFGNLLIGSDETNSPSPLKLNSNGAFIQESLLGHKNLLHPGYVGIGDNIVLNSSRYKATFGVIEIGGAILGSLDWEPATGQRAGSHIWGDVDWIEIASAIDDAVPVNARAKIQLIPTTAGGDVDVYADTLQVRDSVIDGGTVYGTWGSGGINLSVGDFITDGAFESSTGPAVLRAPSGSDVLFYESASIQGQWDSSANLWRFYDSSGEVIRFNASALEPYTTTKTTDLGQSDRRWSTVFADVLDLSGNESAGDLVISFGDTNWDLYKDNTGTGGSPGRLWFDTPNGGEIVLGPRAGGSKINQLRVRGAARFEGDVRPYSDNAYSLGASSFRYVDVWAVDTTINNSDARVKEDIEDSDLGLEFLLDVGAKKWKREGRTRPHYGPVAQDVKSAMDARGIDFAGFIDPAYEADERDLNCPYEEGGEFADEPEAERLCNEWHEQSEAMRNAPLGLRLGEFIGPVITAIKELSDRVEALEAQLA